MKKDKVNVYESGFPWIVVPKLTEEIIQNGILVYMNDRPDGYWFKLYHFVNNMDILVLDKLQATRIQRFKEFDLRWRLKEFREIINQLDNLDKSNILNSLNELHALSSFVSFSWTVYYFQFYKIHITVLLSY